MNFPNLQADFDLIHSKVLVDMQTTNYSSYRINRYYGFIEQNFFIKTHQIIIRAVYPDVLNITDLPDIPVLKAHCALERDGPEGLSCRIDASIKSFLEDYKDVNWYFRAIDDTWVNPNNIIKYISKLEKIVDPRKNIVMKASWNHLFPTSHYINGGGGWLASRATLERLAELNVNLSFISRYSFLNQDDTAITWVLWRIFRNFTDWWERSMSFYDEDIYFIYNATQDEAFHVFLAENRPLKKCTRKCFMYPVNSIISFHTRGESDKEFLVPDVHEKKPVLYMETCLGKGTYVCTDDKEIGMEITSLKELAKRTPIITKDMLKDPFITPDDLKCKTKYLWLMKEWSNEYCRFNNEEIQYGYKNIE